jgi:hypothetical protein
MLITVVQNFVTPAPRHSERRKSEFKGFFEGEEKVQNKYFSQEVLVEKEIFLRMIKRLKLFWRHDIQQNDT